jgi:hypothetical protein
METNADSSPAAKRQQTETAKNTNGEAANGTKKKQILLNAFDMSTVGHLSPGQWKVNDLEWFVGERADVELRIRRIAQPRSEA